VISLLLLVAPISLAARFSPDDWTDSFKLNLANSRAATAAPTAGGIGSKIAKSADKAGDSGANANANADGSAAKRPAFTLDDMKRWAPPTADGNFPLDVVSLWQLAGDPDVRDIMKGQPVETVGQLVKDTISDNKGSRLRVFGLQVTCCAGDARPVSFPIEFTGALPEYREMGWYRVVGTYDFEEDRQGKVSVIRVNKIEPRPRPRYGGAMY
jgi:hypothetical protein